MHAQLSYTLALVVYDTLPSYNIDELPQQYREVTPLNGGYYATVYALHRPQVASVNSLV